MRHVLLLLALSSLAFAPAPRPKVRIELRRETRTWREVVIWLADETDKPFVGSLPTGTLTFAARKRKYSVPEIMVIINRHLGRGGRVMIERPRCFNIVEVEDLLVRR